MDVHKISKKMFLMLMLVAMIFWGAAWVSAKLVSGYPLEVVAFWRFLFTFLGMIPLVLFAKKNLKIPLRTMGVFIVPAVLLTVYNLLFFLGVKTGLSGKGGVVVTTLNPLFTFLITRLFLNHAITRLQLFGLSLGVCGGLLLLEVWAMDGALLISSGNLYFILCAVLWAVITVVSQKMQQHLPVLVFCLYLYGYATVMMFVLALPHHPLTVLSAGWFFWANILFLSLFSITFSSTIYFYASKVIGSNRASSFTFLVPFTAVLLSWMVFGEQPAFWTIVGGVLALAAIYIINHDSVRKKLYRVKG